MTLARCALLIPLLAVLVTSGCQIRNGSTNAVYTDEVADQNQRLAQENSALKNENTRLRTQLADAQAELSKAGSGSIGSQLGKNLSTEGLGEGVTATERGGLALNDDLLFTKGSDELNDEGRKTLTKLAARLNEGEYVGSRVVVEGHTDDTPVARHATKEKFTDNWGLSGARAAAVIRALQADKVDPLRLRGSFRGEYAPRAGEGDKSRNRRVEIFLAN